MIYLADTNIFLEILLGRSKKEACKSFLQQNAGMFCMSDFSFHSIGVILLRNGKSFVFESFMQDMLPSTRVISLSLTNYQVLVSIHQERQLDFDDAYQFAVSSRENLVLSIEFVLSFDYQCFMLKV